MDSMMSSVVGSIIEGYFSVFFNNFRKEDFVLTTGTTCSSCVLHNLEINKDVVQEILGVSTLTVSKMSIDTLTVLVQITNIRKSPVVIRINRLDCLLSEPWSSLAPIPTVLEDFLKKLIPNSKQSYGITEKLIDGFNIIVDHLHVEVDTCGKYKIEQKGEWTPPPMFLDLKGINIRTTSDRWDVIDLNIARDFNKNRKHIYVFKTISVDSLRCTVLDKEKKEIPLIANIPVTIRVVIKKELNNKLNALSMEVILDHFHSTVKFEELHYFVNLLKGFSSCFGRRDKPEEPPTKIPHAARIIGLQIRNFSTVLIEESGGGIELMAKDLRVGSFWNSTNEKFEKKVEFCLGDLTLREFFSRTGPSSHPIIASDTSKMFKNPFQEIPPLARTFHPSWNPYTVEKPIFFFQAFLGKNPAIESRIIVNPILITIRPETAKSIVELVGKATPHIKRIQELHHIKPEGLQMDDVIVQEGKSPLEDVFVMQADIAHVCVAFPSAESSSYVKVCLNIANTKVLSHPKLPTSKSFTSGIAAITEFPGASDDLTLERKEIISNAINLHSVKFTISLDIEWTVQFSPEAVPQRALYMPQNSLDVNVSLGNLQAQVQGQPKQKLEPVLVEASLGITKIDGRLTQLQYQAILARIDQVLLLAPVFQKLGSANTNIEKPKTPVIFMVKVKEGEWTLCNDNSASVGHKEIEPIAGLHFKDIELCVENRGKRKLAKFFIRSVSVTALPNPSNNSKLFSPNAFIHTGSDSPLFAFRLKLMDHPPGELLQPDVPDTLETAATTVRKYLGNRAFYDGERSNLDIRISSLHSGINPNPACDILNFFLKTDINIQRLMGTLREAKKSLDKVDISEKISSMASGFAADFKVDSFVESVKHTLDLDLKIDIVDTRIFLVQDHEEGVDAVNGNICLSVKQIFADRHVLDKYRHENLFRIDEVNVTCNKEEKSIIETQAIFSPVSCKFRTEREWLVDTKEWNMKVGGFFDKIELEVTPTHSRVFMDVVHGVKVDNIRKIFNSIGDYVTSVKSHLPSIKDQLKQTVLERVGGSNAPSTKVNEVPEVVIDAKELELNAISDNVEQLNGWIVKAKRQMEESQKTYKALNTSMTALEERTGEADILGSAIKKGELGFVSGRKLLKRFVAISKSGCLFLFQDKNGGKPLDEMKLDSSTQVGMVEKLKFAFSLSDGRKTMVFSAKDDMDLAGWTNQVLKIQVAGISDFKDQTGDSFAQTCHSLDQISIYSNRIAETADSLKDQTQLLARIKALEDLVRQKDAELQKIRD